MLYQWEERIVRVPIPFTRACKHHNRSSVRQICSSGVKCKNCFTHAALLGPIIARHLVKSESLLHMDDPVGRKELYLDAVLLMAVHFQLQILAHE